MNIEHLLWSRLCARGSGMGWAGAQDAVWGRGEFPAVPPQTPWSLPGALPHGGPTFRQCIPFLRCLFSCKLSPLAQTSPLRPLPLPRPLPPTSEASFPSLQADFSTWALDRILLDLSQDCVRTLESKELFIISPSLSFVSLVKCDPIHQILILAVLSSLRAPSRDSSASWASSRRELLLSLLCWPLLLHLPLKWWGKHPILSSVLFFLYTEMSPQSLELKLPPICIGCPHPQF